MAHSCSEVNRLAIVPSSSMCMARGKRAGVQFSMPGLRLQLSEEKAMDVSTLLIVLLVVVLLGGGGWGYSRWRG
jgi:hypothetical protein